MYLFSLLHKTGFTQLGLEVDENPTFVYKDDKANGKTGQESNYPKWRGVNFADGRWHKVAWAVYTGQGGESIAELYVDCSFVGARVLVRNALPGEITTDGVVIFGRNGFGEKYGVFEGDIQQLDLWDDPNIAFRSTEENCKLD